MGDVDGDGKKAAPGDLDGGSFPEFPPPKVGISPNT